MSQLTPEQQKQLEWATQNLRLEGYEPSQEDIKNAELILRGEKTADDVIKDILKRHTGIHD